MMLGSENEYSNYIQGVINRALILADRNGKYEGLKKRFLHEIYSRGAFQLQIPINKMLMLVGRPNKFHKLIILK